jgi:hypothetical protein
MSIQYRSYELDAVGATSETTGSHGMADPREIKQMTLPIAMLLAMPPQHRSALLMLGLFINEANWLRKLLVGAVLGISDTPDGQANFALTALMATTLAGKIHEGYDRIKRGWLHDAL